MFVWTGYAIQSLWRNRTAPYYTCLFHVGFFFAMERHSLSLILDSANRFSFSVSTHYPTGHFSSDWLMLKFWWLQKSHIQMLFLPYVLLLAGVQTREAGLPSVVAALHPRTFPQVLSCGLDCLLLSPYCHCTGSVCLAQKLKRKQASPIFEKILPYRELLIWNSIHKLIGFPSHYVINKLILLMV